MHTFHYEHFFLQIAGRITWSHLTKVIFLSAGEEKQFVLVEEDLLLCGVVSRWYVYFKKSRLESFRQKHCFF